MREVDPAVDGDRVVDRGDQREAPRDVEHPVAEGLVVVHDVEVAAARSRSSRATRRLKVSGSGNPPVHMVANSATSTQVAELAQPGDAERVGLAVEVQARHLGEPHALVELGVGLAGEHLDVVAERDELAAEVADVDALAAAVRLAAVGQQGDPHATHPREGAGPDLPTGRQPVSSRRRCSSTSKSGSGQVRSISASALRSSAARASERYHLWLLGMTYHGAARVHRSSTTWYAAW